MKDELNKTFFSKEEFFRKEVMENRVNHFYGVCIQVPLKYQVLVPIFLIFIIGLIVFLYFAKYTEKFIVTGYINSAKGVVRIFPKKNGIIAKSYINQGQHVKKGDELFLIDTTYNSLSKNKKNSLIEQIKQRRTILIKEIDIKKNEVALLKKLLEKKYITQTIFDLKRDELIKLKNNKIILEMEFIKHQQENFYKILSPISGKITVLTYKQGQYVKTSKVLVKILPEKNHFLAELYIPINHEGFIDIGREITIRYDAFPYEHFGSYKAKIQDISQSILTDSEEDKPITIGVPYYKATAVLDKQFVTVYGQNKKIHDGMTITAVLKGQSRTILQWILEPAYRL